MLIALVFVVGAVGGSVTGYLLARHPARTSGQAPNPQAGRLATIAPTHPATRRPTLYDWERDGAA